MESSDSHSGDETQPDDDDWVHGGSGESRLERRRLLKNLGLATGAAVASSWVIDSFASPVSAAQGWSEIKCYQDQVVIPRKRMVYFEVAGGGGQGGGRGGGPSFSGYNGGAGGNDAKITGTIAAQSDTYTLHVTVGERGDQAPGLLNPWHYPGRGGIGYTSGARGGDQHQDWNYDSRNTDPNNENNGVPRPNLSSEWAGPGGGGGGSSAITGQAPQAGTITVVAGGGGGGGGSGRPDTDSHGSHAHNGLGSEGGKGGDAGATGSDPTGGYVAERGHRGYGGTTAQLGAAGPTPANNNSTGAPNPKSPNSPGKAAGQGQSNGKGGQGGDGFNFFYWPTGTPPTNFDQNPAWGYDSGGGGGGGGGVVGGGGGSGGGHAYLVQDPDGIHYIGAGGGGGGGSSTSIGVTQTSFSITAGGAGGAGARAGKTAGVAGGDGLVKIYLNSSGNPDPTEYCAYPNNSYPPAP